MLYLYATFYDILVGNTSSKNFSSRFYKLEMKMLEDGIDVPLTINELQEILPILYKYTLEDDDLYFCVMIDTTHNFSIIKHINNSNIIKIQKICKEFKSRIDNQNVERVFKV